MIDIQWTQHLEKRGEYKIKICLDGGYIYHQACSCENIREKDKALDKFKAALDYIFERVGTNEYIFCLDSGNNFRYALYPEYKIRREDKLPPNYLNVFKEFMLKQGAIEYKGLEADDICSIIHRSNEELFELIESDFRTVLVTADKDLLQLGGHFYKPSHSLQQHSDKFTYISKKDRSILRAYQFLKGDPTDNIKGVEGIGDKKADELIDDYIFNIKTGRKTTKRPILNLLDYIFYIYQEHYGYDLDTALYAINHNYNMTNLISQHPKLKIPQYQKWQKTI